MSPKPTQPENITFTAKGKKFVIPSAVVLTIAGGIWSATSASKDLSQLKTDVATVKESVVNLKERAQETRDDIRQLRADLSRPNRVASHIYGPPAPAQEN